MPEVQNRDGDRKPVRPLFSFAEAIIGVAALRDYTRMRREQGQGEDAILAYFYDVLLKSLKEAHDQDPEAYDAAYLLAQVPDQLKVDTRREDPNGP